MSKHELLQSNEKTSVTQPDKSISTASAYTKEDVETLFLDRMNTLNSVKIYVCLRFYDAILEKLMDEKKRLLDILFLNDQKHELLEKYTFPLNPQYFEQKFLEK